MTTTTFTSSNTWTCPSGVTSVQVECWGGGGSGDASGSGNAGGGGAYARLNALTVVPTTVYTVHVGAGATPNGNGGDTWFSTSGTVLAKGGGWNNDGGLGGLGGDSASCIGDQCYSGGKCGEGFGSVAGGGGSAGNASNGNDGGVPNGATAVTGGGAGGDGESSIDGQNGSIPGGGGGGALFPHNAGSGGSGQIILTWSSSGSIVSGVISPTGIASTNVTAKSIANSVLASTGVASTNLIGRSVITSVSSPTGVASTNIVAKSIVNSVFASTGIASTNFQIFHSDSTSPITKVYFGNLSLRKLRFPF